jgi:uncharacterized membrane protein
MTHRRSTTGIVMKLTGVMMSTSHSFRTAKQDQETIQKFILEMKVNALLIIRVIAENICSKSPILHRIMSTLLLSM